MLLFLAKSIPTGTQCEIFSVKERCSDVSEPDTGCGQGYYFSLSFLGVTNRNNGPKLLFPSEHFQLKQSWCSDQAKAHYGDILLRPFEEYSLSADISFSGSCL